MVKVLFSDNNSDVFERNLLIHGTFIDTNVRYCTKQELLLCCAYCGNYFPLNLVKVLFSDNNSDVFEWNWLLLGTFIDIYVRCCTEQES